MQSSLTLIRAKRPARLVAALLLGLSLLLGSSLAMADEVCPKRGGTIKEVDMNWAHLDSSSWFTAEFVSRTVYDSLIDVLQDLSMRPGLATSWTQVNSTTWDFELRKGVKFHDGTDFNADAVKFAMDRLVAGDLSGPSPFTGLWSKRLAKLEVTGPYAVRFVLTSPWPDFELTLGQTFFIPSPTAVKKLGKEFGTRGIVGTGPFMMEEFRPKEWFAGKANPNYYRKGEPCVDRITVERIPSGSVRLLGLVKGDLTNVNTFPESQLPLIEGKPNIYIGEGQGTTLTVLAVNTSRPNLKNKTVRRALQYAVSGKEIIDTVYRGRGFEIDSLFPRWHPGYYKAESSETALIRQDQDKAKALLAEAGFGPGNPLKVELQTFPAPAHVERSVVLQSQFNAVGIEVEVRNIPSGTVLSNLQSGNYDLVLYQINKGPTISEFTWDLYTSESSANYTFYNKPEGYQNKAVDDAFKKIPGILNRDEAVALVKKVDQMIFDDAPYIFLNWRNHREAWNEKVIKNHSVSALKNRQDWRLVWIDQ